MGFWLSAFVVFLWISLAEMFRIVLIVHLSYYFIA